MCSSDHVITLCLLIVLRGAFSACPESGSTCVAGSVEGDTSILLQAPVRVSRTIENLPRSDEQDSNLEVMDEDGDGNDADEPGETERPTFQPPVSGGGENLLSATFQPPVSRGGENLLSDEDGRIRDLAGEQTCFSQGTRVQLIPGSQYAKESCACAVLANTICPDGSWNKITWESGDAFAYQHKHLEVCTEASVYYAVTKKSGSCSRITSIHECAAAACKLGITTLSHYKGAVDDRQVGKSYDPPFCYYEGTKVKFNVGGTNTGDCKGSDKCICSSATCQAATPPANGAIGDCSDALASGSSCQPTCKPGYCISGSSSCLAGTLTAATCHACFLPGTRVQIIPASKYSGESCACSTLNETVISGGDTHNFGWTPITWEDGGGTYGYKYKDLETCVEASAYIAVTSKSASCSPITSEVLCGHAACKVRLAGPGTKASDDRQPSGKSYDPPWCYYEQGKVKFNVGGTNTGKCKRLDKCICKAPTPTLTPAPISKY